MGEVDRQSRAGLHRGGSRHTPWLVVRSVADRVEIRGWLEQQRVTVPEVSLVSVVLWNSGLSPVVVYLRPTPDSSGVLMAYAIFVT